MSSLVRNIQRSAKRAQRDLKPVTPYLGRGSRIGVKKPAVNVTFTQDIIA